MADVTFPLATMTTDGAISHLDQFERQLERLDQLLDQLESSIEPIRDTRPGPSSIDRAPRETATRLDEKIYRLEMRNDRLARIIDEVRL